MSVDSGYWAWKNDEKSRGWRCMGRFSESGLDKVLGMDELIEGLLCLLASQLW